jgi:hypothetical protein
MLSLLDQFFVYHPEPWQDRDWARLSGLPLEDVWFQAADGARLFVGTLRHRRIVLSYSGATAMPAESSIDWRPVRALLDRTVRFHLQLSRLQAETGNALEEGFAPGCAQ